MKTKCLGYSSKFFRELAYFYFLRIYKITGRLTKICLQLVSGVIQANLEAKLFNYICRTSTKYKRISETDNIKTKGFSKFSNEGTTYLIFSVYVVFQVGLLSIIKPRTLIEFSSKDSL